MEDELNNRKQIAELIARRQAQNFCKNAKMEIVEKIIKVEGGEAKTWVPKNDGCEKPRRAGSAWCQECSDKHNATL